MEIFDRSSLHPSIKLPERDLSRPGFEPRPLATQADTLPKSYLNSLHICLFGSAIIYRHKGGGYKKVLTN
jgi:hypothetical protein